MEQSWLNPDFAAGQLIVMAMVILGSLIVLPVVLGTLLYGVLTLIGHIQDMRRPHDPDDTEQEE